MLERTQVFVDTSYLLASFYNSWETGARAQLEIDLPEVVGVLGRMIETQLKQPVQRQMWYDGIPDSGPHRYQRALRTCDGVQLRAGQLIEWGERRTQKAVDTRLVADLVLAGVRGQCSDIVLVSGDADMIPGVQEAANAGLRVHLYGFGWDSMSSQLRHCCDTTTILDPREDFADCMQLQVLEGPVAPTIRVKPIGDAEPIEELGLTPVPNAEGVMESTSPRPGEPSEQDDERLCEATSALDKREDSLNDKPDAPETAETDTVSSTGEPAPAGSTTSTVDPTAADNQQARQQTSRETPAPADAAKPANKPAAMPSTVAPATPGAPSPASLSRPKPASAPTPAAAPSDDRTEESLTSEGATTAAEESSAVEEQVEQAKPKGPPSPSMMAPRRKLRSRYVPLPNEVWASAGFQTPYDVGQQYASWWFDNAATTDQRDQAHLLSGGGLPPEIDRPLLQFACETLHEYTLTEGQRVSLRDGFHSGIRGVLLNLRTE
ncbi:MAG: NYN domain-containing protein [Corynebacterium sp.]|nr:NYN domain-containing protein [Corynebacterium sp.]